VPARAASTFTAARPTTATRAWLSLALVGSVGVLMAAQLSTSGSSAAANPTTGLDDKNFVPLKLQKREKYNHNTDIFHFALADPKADLELPVSSFFVTRTKGKDGKDVIRPYTPIEPREKGVLTFVVKDYPQGVMSSHFHSLKEGDTLDIKGPMPKPKYEANKYAKIGMIAGGTGITPMLQVIDAIIANPNDKTQVSLVFANTTPADILLRERIDAITAKHSNIKVTHIVDQADPSWKGATGKVTKDFLGKALPAAGDDSFTYVCGPPGFMTAVSGTKNMKDYSQGELTGALKELGWTEKNVLKF